MRLHLDILTNGDGQADSHMGALNEHEQRGRRKRISAPRESCIRAAAPGRDPATRHRGGPWRNAHCPGRLRPRHSPA